VFVGVWVWVGVCVGVVDWVGVWVGVALTAGNTPKLTKTTELPNDGAIEYVLSINQIFFVWFGFNSTWYSHRESSHLL
jgi:hypothetical protein